MHNESSQEEHIHLPDPSYWPFALAMSILLIPAGFLMLVWGWGQGLGTSILLFGSLLTVICLMGWASTLIKETSSLPDIMEDDRWMRSGLKLFLVSEAAIFAAFFGHHYYTRAHAAVWPPDGAPHIDTTLPAIATLILMSSSVTMEYAHHLMIKGKKLAARRWVLLTIVLGVIFLGFQGHEYGFLKAYDQFTIQSGVYGSQFFSMTGFHGMHVATGLVMLLIVWFRLRVGHFDEKRHFSFVAASWYWHFVDIIWVFLFFTIYLF